MPCGFIGSWQIWTFHDLSKRFFCCRSNKLTSHCKSYFVALRDFWQGKNMEECSPSLRGVGMHVVWVIFSFENLQKMAPNRFHLAKDWVLLLAPLDGWQALPRAGCPSLIGANLQFRCYETYTRTFVVTCAFYRCYLGSLGFMIAGVASSGQASVAGTFWVNFALNLAKAVLSTALCVHATGQLMDSCG